MFRNRLSAYHFDVTLEGRGVRRLTVNAYGPHHARWKAEEQLKAAGFKLVHIVPSPLDVRRVA